MVVVVVVEAEEVEGAWCRVAVCPMFLLACFRSTLLGGRLSSGTRKRGGAFWCHDVPGHGRVPEGRAGRQGVRSEVRVCV